MLKEKDRVGCGTRTRETLGLQVYYNYLFLCVTFHFIFSIRCLLPWVVHWRLFLSVIYMESSSLLVHVIYTSFGDDFVAMVSYTWVEGPSI
jgi:hypothetical protein